jgi:signal transduction histidine kinase
MFISGLVRTALAWLIAVAFLSTPLRAANGQVLQFKSGDFVFTNQASIPIVGWKRQAIPFHNFYDVEDETNAGRTALWGRWQFAIPREDTAAKALVMDYTTERFIVFVNGREVYRNYADAAERTFASFAPALVFLPRERLHVGRNEIEIRFESDTVWSLGVGNLSIATETNAHALFERLNFWQFLAPQLLNSVIAALTLCVFLFWAARRQERAFFWLSVVGFCWWLRNLHYSAVRPRIEAQLMWEMSVYSLVALVVAFFGFLLTFFEVPNRRKWIAFFVAAGSVLLTLRYALIQNGLSDFPSFLILIAMTIFLIAICARELVDRLSVENTVMLGATTVAISFSVHDLGWLGQLWLGAAFQIQPYASVVVFAAFLYAIGRRFLSALSDVENMNFVLEKRVADASQKLHESEAARHSLEVDLAVEGERERMMLEMHDRIGSGLVTALAVAEQRNFPVEAIETLKTSLLDLRLAVDSLEPIEGDLALLLASFRHRIERDVEAAGLRFEWRVAEVPSLEWLDAVNALHILRIFQEAVSNVIAHAQANVIHVGCGSQQYGGIEGVQIVVQDDGAGFNLKLVSVGKGLSNMESRTRSLGGYFTLDADKGRGTVMKLWFPVNRHTIRFDP